MGSQVLNIETQTGATAPLKLQQPRTKDWLGSGLVAMIAKYGTQQRPKTYLLCTGT